MKAYALPSGNIVVVIPTANSKKIQVEFSESGDSIFSSHTQEFLDAQGEAQVDGVLYSMVENAVALSSNKPSSAELELIYSLVEASL